MVGRKRVLRIISVLAIAIATGHTVETLRANSAPRGDLATVLPSSAGGVIAPARSLPQSASLDAGTLGDMPSLVGITSVAATAVDQSPGDCAPRLSLSAGADATIDVALNAPCNPGERVVIRHAGLSFSARTSPEGQLGLSLPALETEAMVAAYFEGSQVALASLSVPELAGKARFAFQMGYPVRFDLRAEEGGRVFAASSSAAASFVGPIVTLGNPGVTDPILAQVYTFAKNDLTDADITVELRITADTCSRTFPAETVTSLDGKVVRDSLSIALPLCGTAGDILVLKNLVQDPTLAAPN